jgi:hypothetical protein
LLQNLLSGALDADLLVQQPFFGTNYTKPLMFLEDGSYFAAQAKTQNLSGNQWGVMNETGRYPDGFGYIRFGTNYHDFNVSKC